jgi:hypothetical protein
MAILLTALHTAPLPRSFVGFSPERSNFFDSLAPDRQWLGFTQHVSEKVLNTGRVFDGPKFSMPGTDQEYWPSFPIRYATRREDIAAGRKPSALGGGVGAGPAAPSGPPTPVAF